MDDIDHSYYQYCNYFIRRRKLCAAAVLLMLQRFRARPARRIWMHHFIARRQELGFHNKLFLELRLENPEKFRRCLRMTSEMYNWLVEKVRPYIQKQDTHLRKSIPAEERLAVTLRHLATGESQESLSLQFRIGQSTISGIVQETCSAIYHSLKDSYLQFPSSQDDWREVAREFGSTWNFHNCIGAMDGKHIVLQAPINSGSMYFNYKETFSIVLLAVVDAQLRFIYVDVGTNGRVSDKGVWNKCSLKRSLDDNVLNIPPPAPLPGVETNFPFIIVGDEGFTLSTKVLIPFSKELARGRKDRKIFNYRLSRARRCSENAFGLMVSRFQILRSALRYDPDIARVIVLAILSLHNLLRSDSVGRAMYAPPEFLDREDIYSGQIHSGEWRQDLAQGMIPLDPGGNRHANNALDVRNAWTQYFSGPGAVEWQDRMITFPA